VLKPHLREQWVIPPRQNADFVAAMEDVLEVYRRPYDPRFPQVCLDELGKQLFKETRPPLPLRPGDPARCDYEYERNGTANAFLLFQPLGNWRHVEVTERKTRVEFAHVVRSLVDDHFPQAERVVLVMDNLNTHGVGSLYEAFEPAEARRLAEKLEIHHTPKHGSWLNMAETELSVLSRQCLDRRLPDLAAVAAEVSAWEAARNSAKATVRWQFTTAEARVELVSLYPSIQVG
jgi:hypothetical protein